MGKAYHTKHDARKRLDDFEKKKAALMRENQMSVAATSHATLNQFRRFYVDHELSRHPSGTRAKGLRKVLRNRMKSAALCSRERFGLTEEKSSRLRGGRRNVHKAARQEYRQGRGLLDSDSCV